MGMKNIKACGKSGFTLVELMVASLLAGIALIIALPLILVGRNTDIRTEKKEAIALAGEAIFEYVADEMKFAGSVYLGNLTDHKPVGENWKSITVSEKDPDHGENYARLLYSGARELNGDDEAVGAGEPFYGEDYQEKTDLIIDAEAMGKNQLKLTIKLVDESEVLYEKSSVLPLLNLTLNANSSIEGVNDKTLTTLAGEGETPLVLWYQSSKNTVNPFQDQPIGSTEGGFTPDVAKRVTILTNPQYVKADGTVEVKYFVQASNDKDGISYSWELTNDWDGETQYVEMVTAATDSKCVLKGVTATDGLDEEKLPRLTLTVTFADATMESSESCKVVVYEGDLPGHTPVADFVIVPTDLEEEYLNEPGDVPVWIKKNTGKTLIVDAIDKKGVLTEYSIDDWQHPVDGNVDRWKGFNVKNGIGSNLFTADGNSYLENGKSSILHNEFMHNSVEIINKGMQTESWGANDNHIIIRFGGNNETAYKKLGKHQVDVARDICVYDSNTEWKYSGEGQSTYVPAKNEKVTLAPGDKEVVLLVKLDVVTNLPSGVSEAKKPEMDQNSMEWFLERQGERTPLNGFEDTCRLEVGDGENGKLRTGDNTVLVKFRDTAGYKYSETVTVSVPSEIAYVEFDEESYTLLNLDGDVEGVSIRDIGFKAKDIEGNYIDEEALEAVLADETYLLHIKPEDENPATQPFTVEKDREISRVKAVREGKGNLILELEEAVSGKIIRGEGDEPCSCPVEVKNLSLELKLKYIDNNWNPQKASIQSGQSISAIASEANKIKGFDAIISLPEGLSLSETQEKNLQNYNGGVWNQVTWEKADKNSIFTPDWSPNNEYNMSYGLGSATGTCTLTARAKASSELAGTVAVTVTKARAKSVTVSRVSDSSAGQLVIYGDSREAEAWTSLSEKYKEVILRATVTPESGTECDKEVAWSVVKGKDLVDTDKLVLNTWTDSESYMPKIRLRDGLTDEEKDRKIVVRVTSRSSGTSADYTISLLPQFKIVNPDSTEGTIELVHKASSDNKTVIEDVTSLEANKEADWTIRAVQVPETKYLTFKDGSKSQGVKSVSLVTQSIRSGSAEYVVKAQNATTGQADSRTVRVVYSLLDETDESSNAWIIKFDPSGLHYMNVGDPPKEVQVKGGWLIIKPTGIVKEGGNSTQETYKKPGFWEMNGKLTITAVHPGTNIYRATTGISTSRDYIKIIVRGLEFKKQSYSYDIKEAKIDLENELYRGEINNLHWESSNPNIADFEREGGILTLKNPGKTQITVSGYEKSGGKYTAECEIEVNAEAWGQIQSVSGSWNGGSGLSVNLLAGAQNEGIGMQKITSVLTGDSEAVKRYPVYCMVDGGNSVVRVTEVPSSTSTKISMVRAVGAGTVTITPAAARTFAKSPLTANVYELDGIDIEAVDGQGMIHLITGDKKTTMLKAKVIPNVNNPANMPKAFEELEWKIEAGSEGIIDYTDNGDGTCTLTAKDMGTAYITCYSPLNPDIYETYVVIVSF